MHTSSEPLITENTIWSLSWTGPKFLEIVQSTESSWMKWEQITPSEAVGLSHLSPAGLCGLGEARWFCYTNLI